MRPPQPCLFHGSVELKRSPTKYAVERENESLRLRTKTTWHYKTFLTFNINIWVSETGCCKQSSGEGVETAITSCVVYSEHANVPQRSTVSFIQFTADFGWVVLLL